MFTDCYGKNGSLYNEPGVTYVPCNITAVENGEYSSCCPIGNLCMTNGLCMQAQNEAKGLNQYWRTGCTDQTWKDPVCPNVCAGKEEPNHLGVLIFYCYNPKDEYCCTPQGTLEAGVTSRNTSCCNNVDAVFKADAPLIMGTASSFIPRITSSSTDRSSSSSPTSTSGQTSHDNLETRLGSSTAAGVAGTASPTPASSKSGGLSTGAGVGLGVGLTLGVIIAIIGTIFLIRKRKVKQNNGAILLSDSKADPLHYITYESAGTVRAELDGMMIPAEMHQPNKPGNSDVPCR